MTAPLFIYVDASQHFRIAETVVGALDPDREVRILAATTPPSGFGMHAACRIAVEPLPPVRRRRGPRSWAILRGGVAQLHDARRQLAARVPAGCSPTLLVFNDTGIVQRALLASGRGAGWHTVLVQDGLTETGYRESTRSFRAKRWLTAWLLEPLGLGHFGTSRYGEAGAATILSDGPAATAFFRQRAPTARVREVGFLRPGAPTDLAVVRHHVLFWAVDFLGGLQDTRLHDLQLATIAQLCSAFEATPGMRLRVRLHPRDVEHAALYRSGLAACTNLDLIDPASEPDPFAGGLPLASVSLQSAGVLDALAAGIPSWFIRDGGRLLGPAWTPPLLQVDGATALAARLRDAAGSDMARTALWRAQVGAIRQTLSIPFDAVSLRGALDGTGQDPA